MLSSHQYAPWRTHSRPVSSMNQAFEDNSGGLEHTFLPRQVLRLFINLYTRLQWPYRASQPGILYEKVRLDLENDQHLYSRLYFSQVSSSKHALTAIISDKDYSVYTSFDSMKDSAKQNECLISKVQAFTAASSTRGIPGITVGEFNCRMMTTQQEEALRKLCLNYHQCVLSLDLTVI